MADDEGWPPVFPHIRYEEPGPAIAWLTRVFGFQERERLAGPGGTVYVSELVGPGGGLLMVGGVSPAYKEMIRQLVPDFREPDERPWPNLSHSTTVLMPDVDAHHGHARAEGATILTSPADQPWGIREYEALDVEGHHWQFGQVLRRVAPEEWGARRVPPADGPMADFDQLVEAAARAPADTWDFSWLDGRAVEDRPSWRYFDRVVERTSGVATLLEVQAGVGAMIGSLPSGPALRVATEGYPPSVALAAPRLRAAGVHLVVTSQTCRALPFADGSFELVVSRHPVEVWWDEIARVLRPGGAYLAQHVGPHSLRSLGERFVGPWPDASERHPDVERQAAARAGLVVGRLDVERPRTVFYDIGAVVYFLRLVPWIVPDFGVDRYRDELRALHELIERAGSFETTASRMLVEATKPAP